MGGSALTLRRVQFTDRRLHLIRETYEKSYEFDESVGGRRLNDPFDPYGWLSFLTLRRVQFTDGILHHIRDIVVV